MTPHAVPLSAPWETLVVCALLLVAPGAALQRPRAWLLGGLLAALVITLFASSAPIAYGAVAAGSLLHAWDAWTRSRTGAAMLALAAGLAVAVAVMLQHGELAAAFCASTLAIALRAGVMPLHVGAASLCDRVPRVQAQQLASTIALVFVHLRYVDHHEAALALAPALVGYGALAAIAGALLTLAQRDLRGFYRGTTAAHGGMLLAALGSASIGNFAAALLVAVTIGLALGGLGMMITSLEERVGPVEFSGPGGRAGAFPTLAAVFVLFGFAGFALPGTAGFVADDLLLHTLWTASPTSAVAVILTSAVIAVATLIAYSRVFLGPTVTSHAPDLYLRERLVAVGLIGLLILLGIAPGLLLEPADAFLSSVPVLR
jgi:NADH-quinone oxidoreductase subunit M